MSAENRSGIRGWRNKKQLLRLIGEECGGCGAKLFPPRDICPECKINTLTGKPIFKTSRQEAVSPK